ncbi:hypothetical protein AB0919_29830 [Streptomyces sp. NPDC046994]|uniref:DUF4760 domain-containing protein n=3 Tax=unclassified Streptomyces TaxID=2593676 RepID=UPI003453CF52
MVLTADSGRDMSAWDATAAVSSAFSAVIVTVACGYAAAQVREARHARAIQSLVVLHQEYQAPDLRRMRRRIRDGGIMDATALTGDDEEALEDLLQKLELVALLVRRGLVQCEDVVDLFPSVPLIIAKVQPFIDRRRLTQPSYARHTIALAGRYP